MSYTHLNLEVNPDCADVGIRVDIVCKAVQQARFPHAAVSYQQQLQKLLVMVRSTHLLLCPFEPVFHSIRSDGSL